MKKNLIYFLLFLVSMFLFSKFVSAQEKVTYEVDSAYFMDKDGTNVSPDDFKIIYTGESSIGFLNLTTNIKRTIDIVAIKDSSAFEVVRGDTFFYYSYYARMDSVEPVLFGCIKDDEHKLFSVVIINEKKEYVVVFLIRKRKNLQGIKN